MRERRRRSDEGGEEEVPPLLARRSSVGPHRDDDTRHRPIPTVPSSRPELGRGARGSRCRRLSRGVGRPLPKKGPHSHTVGTCADEGGGRRGGQSVASMTGVVLMRKGTRDHVPGTGKARNGWTPRADRPGWTPDTPPVGAARRLWWAKNRSIRNSAHEGSLPGGAAVELDSEACTEFHAGWSA